MNWLTNLGTMMQGGLGRIGAGMFPVEDAEQYGLTPQQVKAMQGQALMRMGLGMMANKHEGFGTAALGGLGQADQYMGGRLGGAYQRTQAAQKKAQESEERAYQRTQDAANLGLKGRQVAVDEAGLRVREQAEQAQAAQRATELEQRGRLISAQIAGEVASGRLSQEKRNQLATAQGRINAILAKPTEKRTQDDWKELQLLMGGSLPAATLTDPLAGFGGGQAPVSAVDRLLALPGP